MPSVRFSRDKRGYEYVYLVHTPVRRGKPGRSRVLYWYRTPPGIRVGRKPFDLDVQRTLEQQNPGVVFDWDAIIATPMPPPDMTEFWRERRRAEKVAKQERRAMEAEEAATDADAVAEGPGSAGQADLPQPVRDADAGYGTPDVQARQEMLEDAGTRTADSADRSAAPAGEDTVARKRRSRRGGRRRRPAGDAPSGPSEPPDPASEDQ